MTCVATHCTLEPCRAFSFFFLPSIAWTLIIEWAYLCSQSCLHGRKELPWQLWMQMSIILQVGKRRQRCGNQTESPALSAVRPRYENVQKFTADNSTNVIVSLCYPCWIKRVCLQSIQAKTENVFFFFQKKQRFSLQNQLWMLVNLCKTWINISNNEFTRGFKLF